MYLVLAARGVDRIVQRFVPRSRKPLTRAGSNQQRSTEGILAPPDLTIWTIGHSTRTYTEFLDLLRENRIQRIVDVRHYPSSSTVPWTNQETLRELLAEAGIGYEHLIDLGGYRKPIVDSLNTGWRNAGFRGYADYMASESFFRGLTRLLALAQADRTAVLCAEAVPWRCHRTLLSDALVVRGARVIHILGPAKTQDHRLTSFAKVHAGAVTYPSKA